MNSYFEHVTVAGDRWDLIAFRFYGDARRQDAVIAANRDLFRDPAGRIGTIPMQLRGGLTVRVPVIEASRDETNLPPWKRNQPRPGGA